MFSLNSLKRTGILAGEVRGLESGSQRALFSGINLPGTFDISRDLLGASSARLVGEGPITLVQSELPEEDETFNAPIRACVAQCVTGLDATQGES